MKLIKFVPAGSEDYKQQIKFINQGAYAVSVFKVKKLKEMIK